jgi:hypothetical protein
MSNWSFFSRKGKRSGAVLLAPAVIKKAQEEKINTAIDDLAQAIARLHGIPDSEREKIRRGTTISRKLDMINIQKELLSGWDWPSWRVDEHLRKVGRKLHQADYMSLFQIVTSNQLKDVHDLRNLDSDSSDFLLSKVINRPTLLALIQKCEELERNMPPKKDITFRQRVHDSLQKIFSK